MNQTVFLAGSIELDCSLKWRHEAKVLLEAHGLTSVHTCYCQPDELPHEERIGIELKLLKQCDYVFFRFLSESYSPISMTELGFCGAIKPAYTFVVCEEGFWKERYVRSFCKGTRIKIVDSIDYLLDPKNRTF